MSDPFWIEARGLYYVVTLRAGKHSWVLKRCWTEERAERWREVLRRTIADEGDPYAPLERLGNMALRHVDSYDIRVGQQQQKKNR